jgi:dihydroflavonol-4-reductase
MRALVELLARLHHGEAKLPRLNMECAVGDFAVKLASSAQPRGVGQYLRTHVGPGMRYDNAKIRRELGVSFRPLEETVRETLADLARWGHFKAA